MAGNVWEFVVDAWEERYADGSQTDPIAGGAVPDEELLAVKGRRALRGGSYAASVVNLRTRWRDSHEVTNAVDFVGFRCAYPAAVRQEGIGGVPSIVRSPLSRGMRRKLVSRIFASWNQLDGWLRQVEPAGRGRG
jgi:hypothetical protein